MNTTSVSYPTDHVTLLTPEHVCSIFFYTFCNNYTIYCKKNTSLHSARLISSAVIKIFTLSSIDRPHPCYTLCGPQKRGSFLELYYRLQVRLTACSRHVRVWSVGHRVQIENRLASFMTVGHISLRSRYKMRILYRFYYRCSLHVSWSARRQRSGLAMLCE